MTQSVHKKVLARIRGHGMGWSFTPYDFIDLGDSFAVGMALSRLARKGIIRRLQRGLYEFPKIHSLLGKVGASPQDLVRAIGRKKQLRLLPAGALAANQLGISNQVPAKMVYATDGRKSAIHAGKMTISLRPAGPRTMALAGRSSGLVLQALRNIGRDHVDQDHIDQLRRNLSDDAKDQLLSDVARVPAWMRPVFKKVANS